MYLRRAQRRFWLFGFFTFYKKITYVTVIYLFVSFFLFRFKPFSRFSTICTFWRLVRERKRNSFLEQISTPEIFENDVMIIISSHPSTFKFTKKKTDSSYSRGSKQKKQSKAQFISLPTFSLQNKTHVDHNIISIPFCANRNTKCHIKLSRQFLQKSEVVLKS